MQTLNAEPQAVPAEQTGPPDPQPSIPPGPPPPETKPISASKGSNAMVILVLLLLAGCGLYYLGLQMAKPKPPDPPRVPGSVIPGPTTPLAASPSYQLTAAPLAEWQSYTDTEYGFSLQYPQDWRVSRETDAQGIARVKFTDANAKPAAVSTARMLPELFFAVASPYSASRAVCENQSCSETVPLTVILAGQNVAIPVVKGEVSRDGANVFDFFAFIQPLPGKTVGIGGQADPAPLYAVGSFGTREEGQTVANIISSLKY